MRLTDLLDGCILVGMSLILLGSSCANDGKRETWQDCAGVYHEHCLEAENPLDCEYECYKECING